MKNEPKNEIIAKILKNFEGKKYLTLINEISTLIEEYPKSIFLLNVLGVVYNQLNNLDEAILCFKKIIKIDKNFADAYYNLGIIFKRMDRVDDAISNYNKCIKIKPNKFEAYNNIGNVYRETNETQKAIEKYLQCLEINPNYLIALQNFGICLQNFYFNDRSKLVDKHIINLLENDRILRPVDIVSSIINYLYLNIEFKKIVENIDYSKIEKNIEKLVNSILDIKILISLLNITPITDLKIERFLKYLRKNILINISSVKNKKSTLIVINAIAKQCFINEYIYNIDEIEKKAIKELEKKISNNIKFKASTDICLGISCLAAYKSLNNYKWSKKILNYVEIEDLVKQQIKENATEENIKKEILSHDISNAISKKVKNQYENNPYPRWTKISLYNEPKNILSYVNNNNLFVDEKKLKNWNNLNILVAGCGTGQHAITTATKFINSQITAIDLSANSLSYAKRKANELEIKNIDFIEMDILDLKYFGKNFEIIESVGVLHHMENPFNGWKALVNTLKPDGLIMIGLYSALARIHIKKIRKKIIKIKNTISNDDIKLFREEVINLENDDYELIKQSPDFYSMSSIRDLIFHTQEHTFTISEISKYIKDLDLKFCGFENREIIKLFTKIYSKNKDLYNLKLWDKFENENYRIFAGMYQFWCQKN